MLHHIVEIIAQFFLGCDQLGDDGTAQFPRISKLSHFPNLVKIKTYFRMPNGSSHSPSGSPSRFKTLWGKKPTPPVIRFLAIHLKSDIQQLFIGIVSTAKLILFSVKIKFFAKDVANHLSMKVSMLNTFLYIFSLNTQIN